MLLQQRSGSEGGKLRNRTPVLLLHGMGDASSNLGMASLCHSVRQHIPGTYVVCSSVADGTASFTSRMETQIDQLAAAVASDVQLQSGFHAIGLSQGGLVLRGYVERQLNPSVRRLITISSPHSGVGSCPKGMMWAYLCPLFELSPYNLPISFSDYWKDVASGEAAYLSSSRWLADVNNEKSNSSSTHTIEGIRGRRAGMIALERYVLVEALNDTFIVPRESTTHGFWAWGQKGVVVSMRESIGYREDQLGLRTLDLTGRLRILGYLGDHLQFNTSFWIKSILSQLEEE